MAIAAAPSMRELAASLNVDGEETGRLLEAGATLPAAFYTDERIARLEDVLIWRPSWHILGVEPEVRDPGDFFTSEIRGFGFTVPVVVVRGKDHKLRAFVNVCRHRGHMVKEGSGNCSSLQCPYHAWTYSLDGTLRAVPRVGEGGIPPLQELSLYSLSVETWGGFVFVAIEPEESLAEAIGELPQVCKEAGYSFPFAEENADPGFTYVRSVNTMRAETNWKAQNENNIECYHCPTIHGDSFSCLYNVTKAKGWTHQRYDRGIYDTMLLTDRMADAGAWSDAAPAFQFYYLWPHQAFSGGTRARFSAGFLRVMPVGVDACDFEYSWWDLPASQTMTDDERNVNEEFKELMRQTSQEDMAAAVGVQRGLNSGFFDYGYTLADSEDNIRHFHKLFWDVLGPAFQ